MILKEFEIDDLFKDKINQIDTLPDNIDWNSNTGWKEYQQKYPIKKVSVIKRIVYYSTAAAAVLIIVFFSALYYQNKKNAVILVQNNTTKTKEITLPDGNSVWLNKNSFIEYPSNLNKEQNEISVSGEVYFEINNKKSHNYVINAHNAVIHAETIASFNIRAYPDEDNIDVTVAAGAIKIGEESYEKGLTLIVIQGNYCSVNKSQKLVYAAANINDNYLAWKTGKLIFNNQPIATVKDILTEYYNTVIELKENDIAYCLFTGSFDNQSLDIVLDQIQSDLHFVIINTGIKITFSGNGCRNS